MSVRHVLSVWSRRTRLQENLPLCLIGPEEYHLRLEAETPNRNFFLVTSTAERNSIAVIPSRKKHRKIERRAFQRAAAFVFVKAMSKEDCCARDDRFDLLDAADRAARRTLPLAPILMDQPAPITMRNDLCDSGSVHISSKGGKARQHEEYRALPVLSPGEQRCLATCPTIPIEILQFTAWRNSNPQPPPD